MGLFEWCWYRVSQDDGRGFPVEEILIRPHPPHIRAIKMLRPLPNLLLLRQWLIYLFQNLQVPIVLPDLRRAAIFAQVYILNTIKCRLGSSEVLSITLLHYSWILNDFHYFSGSFTLHFIGNAKLFLYILVISMIIWISYMQMVDTR